MYSGIQGIAVLETNSAVSFRLSKMTSTAKGFDAVYIFKVKIGNSLVIVMLSLSPVISRSARFICFLNFVQTFWHFRKSACFHDDSLFYISYKSHLGCLCPSPALDLEGPRTSPWILAELLLFLLRNPCIRSTS